MICDRFEKQKVGGSDRSSGIFSVKNAFIVNGAQTVGTIGKFFLSFVDEKKAEEKLNNVYVQIRIIQTLDDNGEPFVENGDDIKHAITINTNMQNKILPSDFASQDNLQRRLNQQLLLEGITYQITRSEDLTKDDSHFGINEAARARCNFIGQKYSLIAHRGVGSHLFNNLTSDEYRAVFNESFSGIDLWNTVKIQRALDRNINTLKKQGKYNEFLVQGKDFVSCLYFYERYHQDVALTSVIDDDDIIQKKLLDICMILENVYENKGYMAINFFKNESLIMELKEKYLVAKK